jgi:Protein of unknown function (DUF2782)
MRRSILPLLLLVSAGALAQDPSRPAEPPPPPTLDEAGPVDAAAAQAPAAATADGPGEVDPAKEQKPITSGEPLPEKVRPSDESAPAVTIRTEGEVTIEEYRRGGQVYMVVVTPESGVRYTYLDSDGDGRLEGDVGSLENVAPVYYTLYEWE